MNSTHDVLSPKGRTAVGEAAVGGAADGAADVVVAVADLEVVRGGKRVLPGVSLHIRRGVVTGLLGPGGSGKTTLMRAIVGVQKVAGGAVSALGRPAGTAALRARVA